MELTLRKKSPSELWNLHREDFLKIYASEQSKHISHSNLEKLIVDSEGKQYYKFPSKMMLPIDRMAYLKGYISLLTAGISGEEMKTVLTDMEKALSDGIGEPKTAAKMAKYISILQERLTLGWHLDLLLNIIAVQTIREDENPEVYNTDIHFQKINSFKSEIEKGNSYFFFQKFQSMIPLDLSKISLAEWTVLSNESEVAIQALPMILEALRQSSKSSVQGKTLKSSL